MTQTGLLAAAAFALGMAGPAFAGVPSLDPTYTDEADGGGDARLPFQWPPGPLTADNDVLRPPGADIDPQMVVTPRDNVGTLTIIPPKLAPPSMTPSGRPYLDPR